MEDKKKRAVIFGAGTRGRTVLEEVRREFDVVYYIDNDRSVHGTEIDHCEIRPVEAVREEDYDCILLATMSPEMFEAMKQQLRELGVAEEKVSDRYCLLESRGRNIFLRDFAKLAYEYHIPGAVAEAGVFQGDFAKHINENFPDRPLYLFDTFEGFDRRDIPVENCEGYSEAAEGRFCGTSEELVLRKMKYPERVRIRKGYFPDTANGLEETFAFVNLDMDLYLPTLAGLRYFAPRMAPGGCIVVHDYFSRGYKGAGEAVRAFIKNDTRGRVFVTAIGDGLSAALYGFGQQAENEVR